MVPISSISRRLLFRVFTIPLLASAACVVNAAQASCNAPGDTVHWIADYCMLKMETDDEIAVSDCLSAEMKKRFSSTCASNTYFKRRMCEISARDGTRAGSVQQCVQDPAFKGKTVEARGVGS